MALALAGVIVAIEDRTDTDQGWSLFGLGIVLAPVLLLIFYLSILPRSKKQLYFKVPAVPFIPCISIVINLYLMFSLSSDTWIRFAVWMALGS